MASRRKARTVPANVLMLDGIRGETEAQAIARNAMRPSVNAAMTIRAADHDKFPDLSLNGLVEELENQSKAASSGDMARMEAIMVSQVHTLDALFHRLTRQGLLNIGHYTDAVDKYLRLAMRAQAQARANIETLHEMKHPKPVAFVQQANIANGPQQVNNGTDSKRTGETQNAPNELLEHSYGTRLEGGTTRAPAAADSGMEAVGALHRSANRRWQECCKTECLEGRRA